MRTSGRNCLHPQPRMSGGGSASVSRQRSSTVSGRGDTGEAERRLASVIPALYDKHRAELDKWKAEGAARWNQPDWIWESLLLALSTMGNARGVELVDNPKLHDPIRYKSLLRCARDQRLARLRRSLKDAKKVRWPDKKTQWLAENFERIRADGGPGAVKQALEESPGREGKIAFLRSFRGIAEKYSRDMLMDVYHPDFRESIALDVRVKNVSKALGLQFANNYYAEEEFFRSVANCAHINGWELDRLLFNFNREVLHELAPQNSTPA
jgi:hypothetical protein